MTRKVDITAFIYDKKGNLLSVGKNSYVKTHPLQAKHAKAVGEVNKIFMHAEINAIAKCRNLSQAYKMVITRFTRSGEEALAKPCKICQRAISYTNIKEVIHT